MDKTQLLDRLGIEVARIRELAEGDLTAPVPTCPGWSLGDLVRHVAHAYLNGALPQLNGTAQQDLSGEEPLASLDRGYAEVTTAFAEPDGKVFFWLRRMAQETTIHRVDAELALGGPVSPIPEDFAADAIGEMLYVFLSRELRAWHGDYSDALTEWGDRWVSVLRWRVAMHLDGIDVTRAEDADGAAATISGDPAAMLLWFYNRGGEATVTGDADLVAQIRGILTRTLSGS